MGFQNLNYHFIVGCSTLTRCVSLLFKKYQGERVFSPSIPLLFCHEVITLECFIQENGVLRKCLGRTSFKYWVINRYSLTINIPRMILYLDLHGFNLLVFIISYQRVILEKYLWRKSRVIGVLKYLEIRSLDLSRSLIKVH